MRAVSRSCFCGFLGHRWHRFNGSCHDDVVCFPARGHDRTHHGWHGNPQPDPAYVAGVDSRYIQGFYPESTSTGLTTPEEFWPVSRRFPPDFVP